MPKIPQRYSVILLILFIAGLYFVTNKAIVPFVMKVVESDLFFAKDEEGEELGKISNQRTGFALIHCKNAMKEENQVPETAQFDDTNYEAWALGGRTYLIRSHVQLPLADKGLTDRKYACKIQFKGGDATDANNWSLLGIDFHEPTDETQ